MSEMGKIMTENANELIGSVRTFWTIRIKHNLQWKIKISSIQMYKTDKSIFIDYEITEIFQRIIVDVLDNEKTWDDDLVI